MNRLLGGACAMVFALIAAAHAGTADFNGPYVGFNLGAVTGSSNASTSTVFCATAGCYFASSSVPAIATTGKTNLNANTFAGGGLFGYNLQHHHLVFGGEADFGSMRLSKLKTFTTTYPCCAPTNFTIAQSLNTGWLFTVRPRLGFTAGPALFYGTGGLAVTNASYQAVFTDTFAFAFENASAGLQNGWTAGGGVEVKLAKHFSFKGEVLHSDFGSKTVTSTNLVSFFPRIAFPANVFTHTVNLTTNNYRFGVNFHF